MTSLHQHDQRWWPGFDSMTQSRFDMEDPFHHLLFPPGRTTAYNQLRGAGKSSTGRVENIILRVDITYPVYA